MGGVVAIPERAWVSFLQEREEERSPVAAQRIISIPEEGLCISSKWVGRPRLLNPKTFDTITLCWLGSLKTYINFRWLITVLANGVKIIDTSGQVKYLCIGEVLLSEAEQRARVGTQRCIPSPLIPQDRLARFNSLPVLGSALKAQLSARASPLINSKESFYASR